MRISGGVWRGALILVKIRRLEDIWTGIKQRERHLEFWGVDIKNLQF
jgi:hypothetical protein